MNIVLVKHNDSKPFAFYVPDEMLPFVKRGQGVMCATMHGLAYGTTTTGVISGDGAKDVAIAHGAYIPLKPVVSFEHPAFADSPKIHKAVSQSIIAKIEKAYGAK